MCCVAGAITAIQGPQAAGQARHVESQQRSSLVRQLCCRVKVRDMYLAALLGSVLHLPQQHANCLEGCAIAAAAMLLSC
jgi:hypothetical protein